MSNPRLIIAVMINEPANGQHYGGLVAAPIFSQVMGESLRLLNVPNDAPVQSEPPLLARVPVPGVVPVSLPHAEPLRGEI